MSDGMMFPETIQEFMEQYKIVDSEKVYTNGTELVPIFRMEQWFDAHPQRKRGKWVEVKPVVSAVRYDRYKCSECGKGVEWKRGMNFCPNCGAEME